MPHHSIIIIGSGMAATTLVREFRKLDKETDVLVISADNGDVYSKPMLSNAYAKGKTADDLVTADAIKFAVQNNIGIKTLTTVTAIDAGAKTISIKDEIIAFDRLVLALGASPFKPPIEGNANDHILTVNDLDDYRVFQDKAKLAHHIAIIGPGLIGCEFANDLINRGKKITIIGPDKWPMSTLLSEPVGRYLQSQLAGQGIQFALDKMVSKASYDNHFDLELSDGSSLKADLVLSAIGLKSNIALAKKAGIACNRGIKTDQFLQSNIASVFALGDCAEVAGLVLPFVMPLMHSARALAQTLAGEKTKVAYPAMPIMVKTPACPLVVSPSSDKNSDKTSIEITKADKGVKVLHKNAHDELIGFELSGEFSKERQALAKQLPAVLIPFARINDRI